MMIIDNTWHYLEHLIMIDLLVHAHYAMRNSTTGRIFALNSFTR